MLLCMVELKFDLDRPIWPGQAQSMDMEGVCGGSWGA